jgi:hypothetical protein
MNDASLSAAGPSQGANASPGASGNTPVPSVGVLGVGVL